MISSGFKPLNDSASIPDGSHHIILAFALCFIGAKVAYNATIKDCIVQSKPQAFATAKSLHRPFDRAEGANQLAGRHAGNTLLARDSMALLALKDNLGDFAVQDARNTVELLLNALGIWNGPVRFRGLGSVIVSLYDAINVGRAIANADNRGTRATTFQVNDYPVYLRAFGNVMSKGLNESVESRNSRIEKAERNLSFILRVSLPTKIASFLAAFRDAIESRYLSRFPMLPFNATSVRSRIGYAARCSGSQTRLGSVVGGARSNAGRRPSCLA